jgi:hypothetical protein
MSQKLLVETGKTNPPAWQTGLTSFVDFDGSQGRRRHSMRMGKMPR